MDIFVSVFSYKLYYLIEKTVKRPGLCPFKNLCRLACTSLTREPESPHCLWVNQVLKRVHVNGS